jgi:hypothetical protein
MSAQNVNVKVDAAYDRFYTTVAQQIGHIATWREARRWIVSSLQHWLEYCHEHPGAEKEEVVAGVEQLVADVRKARSFAALRRRDGMRWLAADRRWTSGNLPPRPVSEAERVLRKLERGGR